MRRGNIPTTRVGAVRLPPYAQPSENRRWRRQSRLWIGSWIGLPLAGLAAAACCCGRAAGQEKEIRLIVRGDDIGSCHAANEACIRCCREGIVRSLEIMVPTPWYREAVKMLKENPGIDVGVHLTLTSEWQFMGTPTASPELRAIVERLSKKYRLPLEAPGARPAGYLGGPNATPDEKEAAMVRIVEKLTPGTWLFVDHPGLDTPEMRAIGHVGYETVAADRTGVTRAFTSEKVKEAIKRRGIRLMSYAEYHKSRPVTP